MHTLSPAPSLTCPILHCWQSAAHTVSASTSQAQACSTATTVIGLGQLTWLLVSGCRKIRKMPTFWPPTHKRQFFVPKTIHWAPWGYHENLETITPPVPELHRHTYTHTRTALYIHFQSIQIMSCPALFPVALTKAFTSELEHTRGKYNPAVHMLKLLACSPQCVDQL